MNSILKNYFKPTPKKMRIVGDLALLAAGLSHIFFPDTKLDLSLGVLVKFLTNFFYEK